jgi:hypothetical protein
LYGSDDFCQNLNPQKAALAYAITANTRVVRKKLGYGQRTPAIKRRSVPMAKRRRVS